MVRRWCALVSATLLVTACSSSETTDPDPSPTTTQRSLTPTGQVEVSSDETFLFAAKKHILVADLGSLTAVDPTTLTVSWTANVPATAAVEAFGSYWASDFDGQMVRRIDPADGSTIAEIPAPGAPIDLAAAAGSV